MKCRKCNCDLEENEAYEYRGAYSCWEHFDDVIEARDYERNEIIREESSKTEPLKYLDFGDNPIGRENRKLMAGRLEVVKKESQRLRVYEGRQ